MEKLEDLRQHRFLYDPTVPPRVITTLNDELHSIKPPRVDRVAISKLMVLVLRSNEIEQLAKQPPPSKTKKTRQ